tara:strand:+ start:2583 stop:3050 length:468 start_codon:yes stop_codon:yes gene_type:complete
MEFSSLVEKIKNIKPHPEDHGYHKSVIKLLEQQSELIKLLGKVYKEHHFVRGPFESFVDNLSNTISNGKLFKKSDDSIKKFLESYLLQYSSLQIEDDSEILILKNVSIGIMNSYNDFLFIVKLLDNDFMLTSIVKVLIGTLNSDLLKKKIYIKNF